MSNDLPLWPNGRIFVMSAPSGTGKTTLAMALLHRFANLEHVPTVTTRKKREREIEGEDYHFVTDDEFKQMIDRNEFVEHIELYGKRYGTLRADVDLVRKAGKHVLLIIDTRGAKKVKEIYESVLMFVKPPSIKDLYKRLAKRGSEDEHKKEERIAWAERELADEHFFDYSIVNANFDEAFFILSSILIAETHKTYKE